MLSRRRAATTGTPVDDHLAPGDLGAMDGHDRQHHHPWVGQHLGGLVSLERHRAQACHAWALVGSAAPWVATLMAGPSTLSTALGWSSGTRLPWRSASPSWLLA